MIMAVGGTFDCHSRAAPISYPSVSRLQDCSGDCLQHSLTLCIYSYSDSADKDGAVFQ